MGREKGKMGQGKGKGRGKREGRGGEEVTGRAGYTRIKKKAEISKGRLSFFKSHFHFLFLIPSNTNQE